MDVNVSCSVNSIWHSETLILLSIITMQSSSLLGRETATSETGPLVRVPARATAQSTTIAKHNYRRAVRQARQAPLTSTSCLRLIRLRGEFRDTVEIIFELPYLACSFFLCRYWRTDSQAQLTVAIPSRLQLPKREYIPRYFSMELNLVITFYHYFVYR